MSKFGYFPSKMPRQPEKLELPTGPFPQETWTGHIERFVGMTQVPTGLVGPLHILGQHMSGEVMVPLATTEGALVASYHRGAKATRLAGGIKTLITQEQVQRCPVFVMDHLGDVASFLTWLVDCLPEMQRIARQQTRFGSLISCEPLVEGNQVILTLNFHTGDAAGQNMVTFCTEAICRYILDQLPVQPKRWYIESNFSGDKKATQRAMTQARGKRVSAECELSAEVVQEALKSTPADIEAYWRSSTVNTVQSGAIGTMGHAANGLTALFLATGQDVACVSEASVGITRLEETESGGLYATVTLPNLIVGTVGGGTGLPTQGACLEFMQCAGTGHARKFAEICAALVLAGELSIAAALAAGHFARAHRSLGRTAKKA
ncbi:hydroxymethylglutaryl-CoA reductase [Pontibacter sp. G13]|uniref:hydroxymethylglutaryl-CoA reductase n=1 Tax=Pontibacter sp. G13 TaxID=3074898 RepID=UPI00288A1951|nr:hydroxymethylglutaryl-CoA reductase [Pontibacter sp. G13]WNJ17830.1 hydroxymethylglutaryl-CoA reductase [Pontibacter sp. G13]